MGLFSHDCLGCGVSARSERAADKSGFETYQSEVVVLLPDGEVFHGIYDGGGAVKADNGESLHIMLDQRLLAVYKANGKKFNEYLKLFHYQCWIEAGKPSYDEVDYSPASEDQGFFF